MAQGWVSLTCLWPHSDAAWPCAALELLPVWWIKKPDWNQLVPHGSLHGGWTIPGLCAGLFVHQGLLYPPAWHLAQAGFGKAGHKSWHPCCCALSPKLTHFKAGAAKITDFPLLEMLYLSCFLIKGRNSSPACRSLSGVSVLFVVSHTTNTYL